MRHEKVQQQLSAFLEDDLAPRRRARLEAHLAECENCTAELHALRRTVEMLRGLPAPEPPPQLSDAVLARVRAEGSRPAVAASLRSFVSALFGGPWLAPLATAAFGALVFLSVSGPGSAPERDAQRARAEVRVAEAVPSLRSPAGVPSAAPIRKPAHFTVSPPGHRRSGLEHTLVVASTAPPEGAVDASTPPPLATCLAASRMSDPSTRASASAQRETCARWYAWMVGLASQDAAAFLQELERLPASEKSEWLARLSEFAMRSGSAPLLARELRAASDPRAGAIAVHFERGAPATR